MEITLGLAQVSLEKVDLRKRSVTVGLWLHISWHDEYLIWNATDYDETSILSVDSKDIWVPDFVLGNFLRPFKFFEPEHLGRAAVRNNGHVTIWPNQEIEFGIEAAITSYPFDTQDCLLMIFTWSYPTEQVNLRLRKKWITTDAFGLNGEWSVHNAFVENYASAFENQTYDYIYVNFNLKRKWLYSVINVMGPIVLTSILNIVCFLLPAESGEKVGFSISIFLTLAVFQNVVNRALPESSDGLSILAIFISLQLVGSVLTITLTVIIIKLHHKEGQIKVPAILVAVLLCGRQRGTEQRANTERTQTNILTDERLINRHATLVTWQRVSECMNRACFVLTLIWNAGLILIFALAV